MLSDAPELVALGCRMDELFQRRQDLRTLVDLVRKFHLAEKFSELSTYVESLLAQADSEHFAQLQTALALATPPATKKDVAEIVRQETAPIVTTLAKVDETTTTINNRDKKYRRKSKQDFTIEQQDGIDNTWQIAKKDPAVKALAKGKSDYASAFIQYRRQFEAYGAKSAKDIGRARRARSERIARMARRK